MVMSMTNEKTVLKAMVVTKRWEHGYPPTAGAVLCKHSSGDDGERGPTPSVRRLGVLKSSVTL